MIGMQLLGNLGKRRAMCQWLSKAAAQQGSALGLVLFSTAVRSPAAPAISKLLVANRGEIACRVLHTAKRLGIPTVAVYSEADRFSRHVCLADDAFCIGPAPARDSYLRGDRVLEVALAANATAVHPGYGFLSENANFARLCEDAGVAFVGPPASAIASMGDKSESKRIMHGAHVPVVPGYHGEDQSMERLLAEGQQVGFPVLVKARLGGGGKGMKLAQQEDELQDAIESAQREAIASFGDGRVLLERFIQRPRHIEVQVFADAHGGAVYLFERDCSVQRRHQKVIEEAPAPSVSPDFRRSIGEAAVKAARAVAYRSAGTVEFIVDTATDKYFFMEMNTRLQVEHPVTEMVTGLDLVEWQLRVAAGEPLPLRQEQLQLQGHAFEARLYAESTEAGFLPAAGTVQRWQVPPASSAFCNDSSTRVDSGVQAGDEVGLNYDPMIAKVITSGPDRLTALAQLDDALAQLQVSGLPTNRAFLRRLAQHPAFQAADLDTSFISTHLEELLAPQQVPHAVLALAAVAQHLRDTQQVAALQPLPLTSWSVPDSMRLHHSLKIDGSLHHPANKADLPYSLTLQGPGSFGLQVPGSEQGVQVSGAELQGDALTAEVAGQRLAANAAWHRQPDAEVMSLWLAGECFEFSRPVQRTWARRGTAAAVGGQVISPMPGRVLQVLVAEGDAVDGGDTLIVIEAMKLEQAIKAPCAGIVASLSCYEGAQVDGRAVLATIEPIATQAA